MLVTSVSSTRIRATRSFAWKKHSSLLPSRKVTVPIARFMFRLKFFAIFVSESVSTSRPPGSFVGAGWLYVPSYRRMNSPKFSLTSFFMLAKFQFPSRISGGVVSSHRSPRSNERLIVLSVPQSSPPNMPLPSGMASSQVVMGASSVIRYVLSVACA